MEIHVAAKTEGYSCVRNHRQKGIDVPKTGRVGIRAPSLQKAFRSVAQLKHIHSNTHRMGNKQELEAIAQQKNYDSCHHGNMVDEFLTD